MLVSPVSSSSAAICLWPAGETSSNSRAPSARGSSASSRCTPVASRTKSPAEPPPRGGGLVGMEPVHAGCVLHEEPGRDAALAVLAALGRLAGLGPHHQPRAGDDSDRC